MPADSFVNSKGLLTRDVQKVHAALPMGGYKGFGLGLFIELLCGSLLGVPMSNTSGEDDYRTRTRGAMIIVINPELTVGAVQFKAASQEFIDWIRQSPPAQNSDGVTLPGDRARQAKQENEKKGYLEIDDKLWEEITTLL